MAVVPSTVAVTVVLVPSTRLAAFEMGECRLEQSAGSFLLPIVAANVASLPGAPSPSPPSPPPPLAEAAAAGARPGGGDSGGDGGGMSESSDAEAEYTTPPPPPPATEVEEGTDGGAGSAALLLSPRPVLSVPQHLPKREGFCISLEFLATNASAAASSASASAAASDS